MSPGASWQLTNFNKKGILQSTAEAKIVSIQNIDSATVEATVEQVFLDKRDVETGANNYRIRCQKGSLGTDLLGILPPQILGAYQNMELVQVGKRIEWPDSLASGQKLPDATLELRAKSGSSTIATLQFFFKNRLVEGSEELITTAGRFPCVKVGCDLESRFGGVLVKRRLYLWLSPKAGIVKSEFFKKKKLEGSQQLTKIVARG